MSKARDIAIVYMHVHDPENDIWNAVARLGSDCPELDYRMNPPYGLKGKTLAALERMYATETDKADAALLKAERKAQRAPTVGRATRLQMLRAFLRQRWPDEGGV